MQSISIGRSIHRLERLTRHQPLAFLTVTPLVLAVRIADMARPRATHTAAARWRPIALLVTALGYLLLGACTSAPTAPINDQLFETYEIATGSPMSQTVIPGFFLEGSHAQIAVLSIDEQDARWLRIYSYQDGAWHLEQELSLSAEVWFVDKARIGGRDSLVTLEKGRLNRIDLESATERELLSFDTPYKGAVRTAIPRFGVFRDLNDDGRDDLVIPDLDGFWISVQSRDGSFGPVVKLGPPAPMVDGPGLDPAGANKELSSREIGVTPFTLSQYLQRLHLADFNSDGRSDLVFWNEGRFEVHLQDARGQFSPTARTFPVPVPVDSDGAFTRIHDFSDSGFFSLVLGMGDRSSRTVLYSLREMNGDDVADLVTLLLEGRTPMKQRLAYALHFGTAGPDGIEFAVRPNQTIEPRTTVAGLEPWGYSSQQLEDFNGDGRVDLMLTQVNMGLGGMVSALVANSASIQVELFRSDNGAYPAAPNALRHIRWNFKRGEFFPPVLMGDIDGDDLADLLVGRSPQRLDIFHGVPGAAMLATEPQAVSVQLPVEGANAQLFDFNRDGKLDLLFNRIPHPGDRPSPSHITTLIAQ